MAPEALAAEIRQLRELTPGFGIRGVRRSLIDAAEQALEADDPECRELAEQRLREVRQIPPDLLPLVPVEEPAHYAESA